MSTNEGLETSVGICAIFQVLLDILSLFDDVLLQAYTGEYFIQLEEPIIPCFLISILATKQEEMFIFTQED